jgi:hypothetical protein
MMFFCIRRSIAGPRAIPAPGFDASADLPLLLLKLCDLRSEWFVEISAGTEGAL